MRMKRGDDTPSLHADLPTPAGNFSSRLLLQRPNKFRELVSNLKDALTFRSVKFAGNTQLASAGWVRDNNRAPSQFVSFAVHGGLVLLLLIPFGGRIVQKPNPVPGPRSLFVPAADFLKSLIFTPNPGEKMPGGGSGGERNPLPVTVGRTPRFSSQEQIVPPSIMRNRNPALLVPPTLEGPEWIRIKNPDLNIWGDPTKTAQTESGGPGCCAGMGTHTGRGIGDGPDGSGFGPGGPEGAGGSVFTPGSGTGVSYPECQYCPRPDYSDEARKQKYMGSVMLSVVVLPDGRAGRIEVLSSPGMGLDGKAVEAVRIWRFRPGADRNGKPVATIITVEIVFQLY